MDTKTQMDRLVAIFEEFKINASVSENTAGELEVEIDEGQGYLGFYASFIFTKDGKFVRHRLEE